MKKTTYNRRLRARNPRWQKNHLARHLCEQARAFRRRKRELHEHPLVTGWD